MVDVKMEDAAPVAAAAATAATTATAAAATAAVAAAAATAATYNSTAAVTTTAAAARSGTATRGEETAGPNKLNVTVKNLETAENRLVNILDRTLFMVNHLKDEGLQLSGERLDIDTKKMEDNGKELIEDLQVIHDSISEEIPRLVKYVPFERSSYGSRKDAEIKQQRLSFAKDYLRETLDQLDKQELP